MGQGCGARSGRLSHSDRGHPCSSVLCLLQLSGPWLALWALPRMPGSSMTRAFREIFPIRAFHRRRFHSHSDRTRYSARPASPLPESTVTTSPSPFQWARSFARRDRVAWHQCSSLVGSLGALSFIGLQAGNEVTLPTNATRAAGWLGWDHYSPGDIDTDILPTIGTGLGATDFVPPLGAGDYAVCLCGHRHRHGKLRF